MKTYEQSQIDSFLNQFNLIEASIRRAKIPFEVDLIHETTVEVSLYEMIKSYHQLENLIREIDPEKFAAFIQPTTSPTGICIPHLLLNKKFMKIELNKKELQLLNVALGCLSEFGDLPDKFNDYEFDELNEKIAEAMEDAKR